mmetsp:Transcript_28235/g.54611  ORF Transcript_28235/g.54611 Transcript_28235/m.54611 type:complete len:86 (-) Transcript_28235:521-778(-)
MFYCCSDICVVGHTDVVTFAEISSVHQHGDQNQYRYFARDLSWQSKAAARSVLAVSKTLKCTTTMLHTQRVGYSLTAAFERQSSS